MSRELRHAEDMSKGRIPIHIMPSDVSLSYNRHNNESQEQYAPEIYRNRESDIKNVDTSNILCKELGDGMDTHRCLHSPTGEGYSLKQNYPQTEKDSSIKLSYLSGY